MANLFELTKVNQGARGTKEFPMSKTIERREYRFYTLLGFKDL